jgi:hypothetical protein
MGDAFVPLASMKAAMEVDVAQSADAYADLKAVDRTLRK